MPNSIARATARSWSGAAPFTIRPPTAPQPKLSTETLSPVFPRTRVSIRRQYWKRESRGLRNRIDRGKAVGERFTRKNEIVVGLQVQPELCLHAKVHAKAGGRICRDRSPARANLADATLRHADFLGYPVLRQTQRLEEFLEEDFPRRGKTNFS